MHGVGYIVQVPLSTFYDLPESGDLVHLNIHTHVREDILQLFGFRTLAEKEMFIHLIAITGIGPKLAISILSGITPDEIREMVLQQNHARLKGIPGVGKKIAERITLELRDKLKMRKDAAPGFSPLAGEPSAYADAFSALINLGYKPAEADKALRKAQSLLEEAAPIEKLLKEALRLLA